MKSVRIAGVPDHPHGRGENALNKFATVYPAGPSPRAWGKLKGWGVDAVRGRTIPTGVGKTLVRIGCTYMSADHPHGRGENCFLINASISTIGPSPRAWGKQCGEPAYTRAQRTIPTGVGKTGNRRAL